MKRTIAAILAADVAGYSRLMAEDEEDTLTRLAAAKQVFREAVTGFRGRVFNTAGDAILAEFPSGVEALRAALAIQGALAELDRDDPPSRRVRFRMGLTIGDVVEVDGDLLGDGVNIAARLEGLAEPGGICLSRTLHEAASGKVQVGFRDIGAQKLKNIPRPVHAFRVVMPEDPARAAAGTPRLGRRALLARWGTLAAALVVAVGLAALWRAGLLERTGGDAGGEGADDGAIAVSVTRAKRACFADEIRLTGHLAPRATVDVAPDAEGLRVLRLRSGALDHVQAGQALADLQRPGDADQVGQPLRSPVAGIVLRTAATAGAPASAAAGPLFQIAAQGLFELDAEAPLQDLARLSPGQGASVAALGGGSRAGRVRMVGAGVDPATQLGRVRIALDAGGEGLRPGQFASAVVRVGERCGVAAPFSAITQEAEGPIVFVANSRRIEARPIVTGLSAGGDVEIRQGLAERDTVVSRAGAFLREGDVIRPVAPAPGAR